ncbi:MAG: hypothetical protein H8D24_01295 [Gammaproteobacteria bacterium]|uniref:Uncharacterized protein n=1 Tax=Candidatus Thiopontia autotrophica TaxID=2841688 RepID=A0A8J6TVJ9_9GAMM|nr:hypothetical protein [Candidatus Thiopontia autotrophica]MBL6969373.1 hypothetical protein [Gammaproteobacteria bacterium]
MGREDPVELMSLSSEDQLRIQVMLHNSPKAIRLDEAHMTMYALTPNGEASIPLSPNCNNDQYLRYVREMLSEHVLGSSGGYPNYIKRWSRMGQTGGVHLGKFLLLGDPEAVVAVANSSGLNVELAHNVWWTVTNTVQQAEQGTHMLRHPCVVNSSLGREIAQFLVEHLAFVTDTEEVLLILSLLLQDGLLDDGQIERIWRRSQERGKGIYQVAFLQANPLSLPDLVAPHPRYQEIVDGCAALSDSGNSAAKTMITIVSSEGQTFIALAIELLGKVANEDSVYALMNAIGALFSDIGIPATEERSLELCQLQVGEWIDDGSIKAVAELLQSHSEYRDMMQAVMLLSCVREEVSFRMVLHSGAVGRSIRKKLTPLFELIRANLETLQK